jgi:alpha-L-fucosidase
LNIGPRADGSIPEASLERVRAFGQWIRAHREVLLRAEPSDFGWNNTALVTCAGNSVFLHFDRLPEGRFCWAETETPLQQVRLWPAGETLAFKQTGPRIVIEGLSASKETGAVTTIELTFASKPTPRTEQTTFWIPD